MLTIDKFTVESLSEDCVTDSPGRDFPTAWRATGGM